MPTDLPQMVVTRKTGEERLHRDGHPLLVNLLTFWQWSASDLVSNVSRGRLAEFIVANALGIDVSSGVRNEWDAFDLLTRDGLKVEVKSAAHIQSWYQARLSNIVWRTPLTRAWDPTTNRQSTDARRQADVYVMALLQHQDKVTIDPLNVEQWCFFVLPTVVLNSRSRSQHSITLKSLKQLSEPVTYTGLAEAVIKAGAIHRASP